MFSETEDEPAEMVLEVFEPCLVLKQVLHGVLGLGSKVGGEVAVVPCTV